MIALVLAAALLVDPMPKQKLALKPTSTPAASSPQDPSGRTLASVAVTLECTARADGRVENCRILGETHPGLGFGDAAMVLMRDAEVAPGPRDVQFARTIQFLP